MRVPDGMITAYEIGRDPKDGVIMKFTGMHDAIRGGSGDGNTMPQLLDYVAPNGAKYRMWSCSYPQWFGWRSYASAFCLALPGNDPSKDDKEITIPAEHWPHVCAMLGVYNTKLVGLPLLARAEAQLKDMQRLEYVPNMVTEAQLKGMERSDLNTMSLADIISSRRSVDETNFVFRTLPEAPDNRPLPEVLKQEGRDA